METILRFIYIVDDDRIAREIARVSIPRDTNTLIHAFESGVDFVKESDDLDPGVLLLDLNMPELDGNAVLEQLKSRSNDKFVTVLVTATTSVPLAVVAMKYGAFDVVMKPFAHEALAEVLARAFEKLDADREAATVILQARCKIASLSRRERTVLQHMFEGCSNKVTAMDLGLSPRTVEIYRAALMRKLEVHDLAHAVRLAITAGWLPGQGSTRAEWEVPCPE